MNGANTQNQAEGPTAPKPIPGSCSLTYRRNVTLQTDDGPAMYWGEIDTENGGYMKNGVWTERRNGKGTTLWRELQCEHSGVYVNGCMEGPGYLRITRPGNGSARFIGEFKNDCPTTGIWQEVSEAGVEALWEVSYDGSSRISLDPSLRFGAKVTRERQIDKQPTKEGIIRVIGLAVRPNLPGEVELCYEHCKPINSKLVWARPPHADCTLFNPDEVRGKVAVAKRGLVDFGRKALFAQQAGAVALMIVGQDPSESMYHQPLVIYTGPQPGDDLSPELATLAVEIPTVYALNRFEGLCDEGADCFLHFETSSPPPWKLGAAYIKAERRLRKLRNPEGEAQAQWSEGDLDLSGGGRKAQMVASDGRIVTLAETPEEMAAKPRTIEARAAGTQARTQRECGIGLVPRDYTAYGFQMTFGKFEWTFWRRFSDFDRLDALLNSKYGLPPVGLPPKQIFGRMDETVVRARQRVLLAYVMDCVRRPVLIHSPELQAFCEMPPDVVTIVMKGG